MIEGGRILVVDDERLNRRLLEVILGAEGYLVLEAPDGDTALALLAREPVDLVLLDVMMPGLDGVEVCRLIRDDLALPLLPVVMLTALTDASWRSRARAAGADDFLTKPIDEDELLLRVKNLLLMRAYYRLSESQRRAAMAEARRWKLVSQVADAVAQCRDHAGLLAALLVALGPELDLTGAAFYEAEGAELRCRARVGTGAAPTASPTDAISPVRIAGRLYGVLALARATPFAPVDLALLAQLGVHLANAVANVRSQLVADALAASREQLAHLLVHDFKNPLFAIRLNLDALDGADDGPPLDAADRALAMRDLRDATERLLAMTLDLLDIGCAEDGSLALVREPVDVHALIEEAAAICRPVARHRDVTVATAAPRIMASLDARLMRRVLGNLLDNASRYVPSGGRIEVTAHVDGDRVGLRVANDGPAIPAAAQASLFDKYARVHPGSGAGNRGLGLYLCRLVAEAHGGTIVVGDRPAGGVVFELRIPWIRPIAGSM